MKLVIWLVSWLTAALSAFITPAQSPADSRETIRRTLQWSGSGARELEVSNINGSIHVVGYDGTSVEMVANRTIRAASDEAMADARRTVKLDATEGADLIRVCGDIERCGCNDRSWTRRDDWREDRYRVTVDFDVRVPRDAVLRLCTINRGDLTVEETSGSFDATHVNGSIHMTGVRGSGRATTVNGSVEAAFVAAPASASTFRTVNGTVEVRFPNDLSAHLRLKTFNGGIYTDFDVTSLSSPPPVLERRNKMSVYRSNRLAAVRVGLGGPELTFENVNGDVRVLRQSK